MRRARWLERRRQAERALELYRRAAARRSRRTAEALLGAARCLIALREWDEVLPALMEAQRSGAPLVPAFFEAAGALLKARRYRIALRLYGEVERAAGSEMPAGSDPAAGADSRLYFNTGYALSQLGRPFAAARAYRRALEIDPRDADAWFNLGNAYRAAGALRKAARAYRESVQLNPADHEAWNNLGNCSAAMGDVAAAGAAYRSAIALRPGYHPAWNNLGNLLESRRRHREAIACYDRAIMLEGGKDLLCFFNRSLSLLAAGREAEARDDIRRWSVVEPPPEMASASAGGPDWVRLLRDIAPARSQRKAG